VVGVVRDIPLRNGRPSDPIVYESYLQQPARFAGPWGNLSGTMTFVVRHDGQSEGLAEALRRAAAGVAPEIPLGGVSLVTERLAAGRASLTRLVRLASMLALVASLLAVIGIHGIVAYGVRRERRQLAIRMALGATPDQVVGFVAARTAPMIVAGVSAGIPAALLLSQFLGPHLWGITPADPLTYIAACGTVSLLAALACVAPTRRALDVNPATALRVE
jgi:predicted lysophospholipase L1 biosynthesis ABC-type transport system permease subunit